MEVLGAGLAGAPVAEEGAALAARLGQEGAAVVQGHPGEEEAQAAYPGDLGKGGGQDPEVLEEQESRALGSYKRGCVGGRQDYAGGASGGSHPVVVQRVEIE